MICAFFFLFWGTRILRKAFSDLKRINCPTTGSFSHYPSAQRGGDPKTWSEVADWIVRLQNCCALCWLQSNATLKQRKASGVSQFGGSFSTWAVTSEPSERVIAQTIPTFTPDYLAVHQNRVLIHASRPVFPPSPDCQLMQRSVCTGKAFLNKPPEIGSETLSLEPAVSTWLQFAATAVPDGLKWFPALWRRVHWSTHSRNKAAHFKADLY